MSDLDIFNRHHWEEDKVKLRTIIHMVGQGQGIAERMFCFAGGTIVVILAVLIATDVALRYLFNKPIAGLYELSEFMFIGSIFLGIALLQAEKGHVNIELLTSKLPLEAQRVLNIFSYSVGLVAFFLITWRAGYLAWQAWYMHDYSCGFVQWPMWPAKSVVPLGTGLLCLRLIRDLWQEFTQPKDFKP
jgi:TRAP-type C4-dicarboxylate transport system permease small subunit